MKIIAYCNYCGELVINPVGQEIGHDGKVWSYCKKCFKKREDNCYWKELKKKRLFK